MGERRLCIRDLNPHIVCILCAGYFIDATTVTECLHTFCKSCIVKYLQTSKHCPMCNVKIHDTQPLFNLKLDRVMQEIVYKLVPNLMDNEENRRMEFDKSRRITQQTSTPDETYIVAVRSEVKLMEEGLHSYLYDEQISLCLEPVSLPLGVPADVPVPGRKYIRCSVRTQIVHIKRLLPRLWPCYEGQEVDILCLGESMPDNSCLKYIWLAKWIEKAKTLTLQYRVKRVMPYSFHMLTPMLNGVHK